MHYALGKRDRPQLFFLQILDNKSTIGAWCEVRNEDKRAAHSLNSRVISNKTFLPAISCIMTQTSCACKGLVQSAKQRNATSNTENRPSDVRASPSLLTRYNCSRLVAAVRLLCIASIAASNFSHATSSKSAGSAGLTDQK